MKNHRARISTQGVFNPTRVKPVNRAIAAIVDRVVALAKLDRMYQQLPHTTDDREFTRHVLALLDIKVEASARGLAHIPRQGAVVVIANHPFGAIEGIIMAHLLRALRDDVRIMANRALRCVSEMAHLFIDVDPFGGSGAVRQNIRPLRAAMRWVQEGGLLMVFPAGEVSQLCLKRRVVTDPEWNPAVASIVRKTGATVVPIYIHGANSLWFQIAGLVHPRLRTAMLPRELLKMAHRRVRLSIGGAIGNEQLRKFSNDSEMIAFLRMRTYLLGLYDEDEARAARAGNAAAPEQASVIESVPCRLLRAEFESLPVSQVLVVFEQWRVVYASARQIPWTLQEIGRLREQTFRAVGEGTGNLVDIDLFDAYYLHLFLWNTETSELAGAYRIGLTDEILARFGLRGLYTHSLFNYRERLIEEMQPALELGRSFVRAEYQRSYTALMLLWRGIGEFVVRHPRHATLYGPVSISNDYQPLSRALLVDYLRRSHSRQHYARDVRARNPFRGSVRWLGTGAGGLDTLDMLDTLIAEIEPDGKGAPVLVRHYVKLGGQFLGFNVDDKFGAALDGLVMVDLRHTEPRLLARYMGKTGAEQFLHYHRLVSKESAPAA